MARSRSRRSRLVSRSLWAATVLWSCAVLFSGQVEALEWKKWLHKGKATAAEAIEWVGYHSGIGGEPRRWRIDWLEANEEMTFVEYCACK
jgi:hypothetical protein